MIIGVVESLFASPASVFWAPFIAYLYLTRIPALHDPKLYRLAHLGTAFVLVTSLSLCALYPFFPGFFDATEPNVVVIGVRWSSRFDPYPPLSSGLLYGLGYGPLLFVVVARIWKLASGMFFMKVAFASFFFASLPAYFFSLRRFTDPRRATLATCAVIAVGAACAPATFWIKPDPIIFAIVCILPTFLLGAESSASNVVAGFLFGLIAMLKPNEIAMVGLVCLFPRRQLRDAIAIGLVAALFAAALFWMTGVEPPAYYVYLAAFRAAGLGWAIIAHLALVGGVWLGLWFFTRVFEQKSWLELACAAVATLILAMSASILGAGTYYLYGVMVLPFTIVAAQDEADHHGVAARRSLVFLACATLLLVLPSILSVGHKLRLMRTWSVAAASEAELTDIVNRYGASGLAVGESDTWQYFFVTRAKYLPAVMGGPYFFDPSAMGLLLHMGVSRSATAAIVRKCAAEYFALPREGEPFSILNPYDGVPEFDTEFRSTFRDSYQLISTGTLWSVYQCKSKTAF